MAVSISSVSGTVQDTSSVTISGSGFGTHGLAIETIKANIESGTHGANFSPPTNWSIDGDFEIPTYTTSLQHSRTKSLQCIPLPATSWNCIFKYNLQAPSAPGDVLYVSWWVRKDAVDNTGQWKMLRLSEVNTIVDGTVEWTAFNWDPASGGSTPGTVGFFDAEALDFPNKNTWPWGDNSWYRSELIVTFGSAGNADAVYDWNRYSLGNSDFNTFTSPGRLSHPVSSDRYNYVIWQNYGGNGLDNLTVWIDDVYIQTGTRARVEIADTSTWATRTHSEIQVPTSWADGSISATVQRGSFGSTDTAYLYVIDSAGAVNANGFQVTFGAGSGAATVLGERIISFGGSRRRVVFR